MVVYSYMQISDCMAVIYNGILIYKGSDGALYQIIGGKDGQINLTKLPD